MKTTPKKEGIVMNKTNTDSTYAQTRALLVANRDFYDAVFIKFLRTRESITGSEFVMDSAISNGAFRLYSLLESFAFVDKWEDGKVRVFGPGRLQLSKHLRVTLKTVTRYVDELVAIGALEVEANYADDGGRMPNGYVFTWPVMTDLVDES